MRGRSPRIAQGQEPYKRSAVDAPALTAVLPDGARSTPRVLGAVGP